MERWRLVLFTLPRGTFDNLKHSLTQSPFKGDWIPNAFEQHALPAFAAAAALGPSRSLPLLELRCFTVEVAAVVGTCAMI